MTRILLSAEAALLSSLLLLASSTSAQTAAPDAGGPSLEAAPAEPLEPAALESLRRMGALLGSSQTLSFAARGFREEPATTVQTVAFFRTLHVQLQRPDKARIDVHGDRTNVSLFYDGTTVTLLDPLKKAFASTPAPKTIDQTIAFLSERFGTVFTISPFLAAHPFELMSEGLKTAFVVGEARVDGVVCDQLAFTEKDVDWQLWVEQGPRPLPRRIAVAFKTRPGAPREILEFSDWKLGASIPASTFVFHPPPSSFQAEMTPLAPEGSPKP